MRGQRTVHYLIAGCHVGMKISTTLLVDVPDIDVATIVGSINGAATQALANASSRDVTVALRVLGPS